MKLIHPTDGSLTQSCSENFSSNSGVPSTTCSRNIPDSWFSTVDQEIDVQMTLSVSGTTYTSQIQKATLIGRVSHSDLTSAGMKGIFTQSPKYVGDIFTISL